ncbi:MAG: cyclodeaminase/cyclohydrolase family protein [Phycisphaerae bacterium]|nr:cyclodeaminase/cyclohydrolase family protein [Phycisphaerae bacterium]
MDQAREMLCSSVEQFVAATAAKQPTPGGGSVAGLVAALAAALGEMSLNFTRGKKKYAEHEAFHAHLGARLEKTRRMFLDLIADDVTAYGMYAQTSQMPDGPGKKEAEALALAAAIDVPRETAKLALALQEDLLSLADKCNPWLLSDLIAAGTLAAAVTVLCDLNVRINAKHLSEAAAAADLRAASTADRARAAELAEQIEKATQARLDG